MKSKDKKVSYLFGTIHMIPDSLYYFPSKLDKIISKSDEVILEVANLSDQSSLMKLMMLDSGSCFDIFTAEQKDSVLNWGADLLGVKSEQFEKAFEKRKPFTLLQLSFQKMISGKIRMVDMEIESKAQHDKIPVTGLETVEYQLSIFDKIPSTEMANFIMETVRHPNEGEENFRKMAQYYNKQDLESLAKLILESDELGSSAEELLDKRNKNWIPKMENLMNSKTCFFAVGAGHLGGPNGVIELLRQKGYEVTPVRY
ncbi:TraB/GumN family protein [Fluviicola sp.]|uniref:TraB/GumN family protein n=1 Tax=Fluviicola sp. TaxID=1917219 RepID=UPI003D26AFFD